MVGAGASSRSVELAPDSPSVISEEWDALVEASGGSVFHTSAWLTAYERAGPNRSQPYHLLARDRGRLVGILPCYLTSDCPRLEAVRMRLVSQPTGLEEPMLLAHSFYAYYGGPLALPDRPDVVEALIAGFTRLAAELRVSVHGFVNVPQTQPQVLDRLRRSGYVIRYSSSCMVLPLRWQSFDSYLESLPGKRRRLIRAMDRRSQAAGLVAELLDLPPDLQTVAELEAETLRRHGHAVPSYFPERYLRALTEDLGERARFLVVRAPGRTPSLFFLMLDDRRCLTSWMAGIDYERLRAEEPYHHAYRWLIRYAIEHGYREVDMGRGSYRFKARYGFSRRILFLALSTTRPEWRGELERWSADYEGGQWARYELEFQDRPSPRPAAG